MSDHPVLRVYLEGHMLATSRAGTFNFMNLLKAAVEGAGWRVEWHETGPAARHAAAMLDGYALYHMEAPTHDRALTFRRAYHYPFWRIEPLAQRWRFKIADPKPPRDLPATCASASCPVPIRGANCVLALAGHIRRCRRSRP